MNTLSEFIQHIGYDSSWGIWATPPFTPDSEARYGQCQFENGGVLDEKVFAVEGERCGDFMAEYCPENEDGNLINTEEGARALIEEIEQERLEEIDAKEG